MPILAKEFQVRTKLDTGTDIRYPSNAVFGISSVDRYASQSAAATNPTSPYQFTLTTNGQNFLNGYFTRLALTEVRFPWTIPTITPRNDKILLYYWAGASANPVVTNITIPDGWYDCAGLATALQTAIQVAYPAFTVTFNTTNPNGPVFTAYTGNNANKFSFAPYIDPLQPNRTGLFEMMNWVQQTSLNRNDWAATMYSGIPNLLSTKFVDIVCSQLTYNQDVKDADTGTITRDILARVYLTNGSNETNIHNTGSAPFMVYRDFSNAKQIKWSNIQPVGNMSFEVYDDSGYLLSTRQATVSPLGQELVQVFDIDGVTPLTYPYDGSPVYAPVNPNLIFFDSEQGDWNITVLASEV